MILGFIFSGIGVLGQAHVVVRSMAINNSQNMELVRKIYLYLGYSLSLGSIMVGLAARVLYPDTSLLDSEMIMPTLTQDIFHPVFAGFLLAAVFASTISTADSNLGLCFVFFSQSFLQSKKSYLYVKLATILTVIFTLLIALYSRHVFTLIVFSWAVLASSLTALVIVKTLWERPL